jgi:hypothetical protein
VHVRDAEQHAGVVDEIAGREVVGAVDDHVVAAEDVERVGGGEARLVRRDVDVRVDRGEPVARGVGLRAPDVVRLVEELPVQVRRVDAVVVDDADVPDAGGGEVHGHRGAEPARADDEHARSGEPALAALADPGEDEVTAIAGELRGAQGELAEVRRGAGVGGGGGHSRSGIYRPVRAAGSPVDPRRGQLIIACSAAGASPTSTSESPRPPSRSARAASGVTT